MTKRILFAIILIILMAGNAFCAATATQVDFLLAGLERNGSPLSGGKIFTYEAGTTTAKECWTDRDKGSSATNPVILSSEGRSTVFCDGVYKMVVKTSADVTLLTMDGISYGPQGAQWTALSSYGSLSEAIADIGVTDTVLLIDTTDTLNANVTVPTNVTLMCTTPDAITLNSKILTVNGGIWALAIECFIGTGTFTGSPVVQFYDPTWTASTVTDTTTPSHVVIELINPILNSVGAVSNRIVFSNTVSFSKGADIISANTLTLGADGNYFDVTGTTGITNISSRGIGTTVKLHFDGAVTITNSSNIENIGAVNVTTAAGDEMEFIERSSGQWGMTTYSGHVAASFRGALVHKNSPDNVGDNSLEALEFNDEDYDTDSIHDNDTNDSRLTVPAGVTRVKLIGQVVFDADSTGIRSALIYKNGAGITAGSAKAIDVVTHATEDSLMSIVSPTYIVIGGDYFELMVYQNSGGALATDQDLTWFAMEIVE